ncbi:MotE family protein [Pelagivirga sediminicola]|nr:hypothetical protein [Pelagivirga sediminicola]
MITGLLVSSAVLRAGNDAGQAWARGSDAADVPRAVVATAECKTDDDLHAMLKDFQEREARLEKREQAMTDRQQALSIADQQIEIKLARLEQAEKELRRTMTLADTAADGDVEKLTKVYENMKPKQAAALFEEMAPDFAAGFLGRMRPEAAAAIMAGLSPQAAHTFSVVLAGRNAGAPRK